MTKYMRREVTGQPDMIREKVRYWFETASEIIPVIKERKNIILLGRGTSGNACIFASYLFGITTGRHPVDFRPWLATQETAYSDLSDSVVLAYSQSGESTDIVHSSKWLHERGAKVISITNAQNKNPSIAKFSDKVFFLDVGEEKAIPATKTYCAQLFATAALAGIDITEFSNEISECMNSYLKSKVAEKLVNFILDKNVILWLGRGLIQAAATDSALKLEETAGIPSFGWSKAEFLHGPIGSVHKNDGVIIFDEAEKTGFPDPLKKILDTLDSKGIEYFKIGNSENLTDKVSVPEEMWAKAIFYSFIGQYTALRIAEKKGLNPDKPGGLNKVTLT